MADASRIGVLRLEVDGDWDIDDLLALSEGLAEAYGLFYPLVAPDEQVRDRLHDLLRKQFWSGDFETRHFGRYLYRSVPKEDGLRIRSFSYASPGAMEIVCVLAVLLMLSRVVRSWIQTGDDFIELWKKVDGFFEKRKSLRRPPKRLDLDDGLALSSDEARTLVFEVGDGLGFDVISCERLIDILGNPIAALKFLVAAGNEGQKLARLERAGLLRLPHVQDADTTVIGGSRSLQRERVVRKKSRRRKR